ncbi:MAG: bifunctional 5,10-methylenetetrahydrofolate dehydrogenase/5,10-methenyltetrahydrofolate cyclohydrolase, partial [Butyrivibrio sp.]|nr:bifunctional 5,10-methylenetetrahydrofolate dehydrogenase/5,10-methenyltetrahydrofolate cyclohydrolase [Butyrivibrio sp.]
QEELLALIDALNADETVDGILVQMPVPPQIDAQSVICRIRPDKDVDGFHPVNVGNLCTGAPGFLSCTPAGVIELLKRADTQMEGAKCVIVGRSNIVGKPMIHLMLRENATVTVAHSKTQDLAAVCREADILIAAVGISRLLGADCVKEGATVIDVGINRDPETGKLSGDVDFDAVVDRCRAITPVPGGVGPMTIAMLMKNCLQAAQDRNGLLS